MIAKYQNNRGIEEAADFISDISLEDGIDWIDIAEGFYTLTENYDEISLEEGSKVFRELKENYLPSKAEAEEVLFQYAVEGETLESAIESEIYN